MWKLTHLTLFSNRQQQRTVTGFLPLRRAHGSRLQNSLGASNAVSAGSPYNLRILNSEVSVENVQGCV